MRTLLATILILSSSACYAETWAEKQARFKQEIEARYKRDREADKKKLADLSKPKPKIKSNGPGFFYTDQNGVQRYYDPGYSWK